MFDDDFLPSRYKLMLVAIVRIIFTERKKKNEREKQYNIRVIFSLEIPNPSFDHSNTKNLCMTFFCALITRLYSIIFLCITQQ